MKSCPSIQSAIYIRHGEVRTCCQRFFHKGKLKGDVVLYKFESGETFDYEKVLLSKENLLNVINSEIDSPCTGCKLLEDKDWLPIRKDSLTQISFENHSLCNMKCTYCSPEYYGGKKPNFQFTEEALKNMQPTSSLQVSWAGGEPTILPTFESTFKLVTKTLKPQVHKVFSNSLRYSRFLQLQVDNGICQLTTSVDSGTEETFQKIRGTNGLFKVLKNLKSYSKKRPDRVTIKYILTKDNSSTKELDKFIGICSDYSLMHCSFLISTNYKCDKIDTHSACSLLYLYYGLKNSGAFCVTIDDHVYSKSDRKHVEMFLEDYGKFLKVEDVNTLNTFCTTKVTHPINLVIWGTGEFSKRIIANANSRNTNWFRINRVVDSDPSKKGISFCQYIVGDPSTIKNSDDLIIIASSNFYRQILDDLDKLDIDRLRILPNFLF